MDILKGKKSVNITLILLMVIIIVFCGCIGYPPKRDLEKYIVRIYDDTEELNVIFFVENYDFLDFIPLEENDSRVFSEFGGSPAPRGSFVRNISDFLVKAESHYDNDGLRTGVLEYVIECANFSSYSSFTDVLQLAYQLQESQASQNLSLDWPYPISNNYNFGAYYLHNTSTPIQIKSESFYMNYFDYSNLSDIYIANLTWIALVDIRYDWSGINETCLAYDFTELILLTSDLKVIGLFSSAGGRIC